jgi:hypothetical protein
MATMNLKDMQDRAIKSFAEAFVLLHPPLVAAKVAVRVLETIAGFPAPKGAPPEVLSELESAQKVARTAVEALRNDYKRRVQPATAQETAAVGAVDRAKP